MAALYLDNDVPASWARLLRIRGHDVITVRDLGTREATDGEHLLAATQQGRILITHNGDDYVLLHDAWRRWFREYSTVSNAPLHASILVVPQPKPQLDYWPVETAVAILEAFLVSTLDLSGRAFEWTPVHGWRER